MFYIYYLKIKIGISPNIALETIIFCEIEQVFSTNLKKLLTETAICNSSKNVDDEFHQVRASNEITS